MATPSNMVTIVKDTMMACVNLSGVFDSMEEGEETFNINWGTPSLSYASIAAGASTTVVTIPTSECCGCLNVLSSPMITNRSQSVICSALL